MQSCQATIFYSAYWHFSSSHNVPTQISRGQKTQGSLLKLFILLYHFAFDISVLSDAFTTVLFEVKFSRSIWINFKLKLKTCITILASQTTTNMFLKQTTEPSYSKTTRRAIIIYRIYMGDHFLKLTTGSHLRNFPHKPVSTAFAVAFGIEGVLQNF